MPHVIVESAKKFTVGQVINGGCTFAKGADAEGNGPRRADSKKAGYEDGLSGVRQTSITRAYRANDSPHDKSNGPWPPRLEGGCVRLRYQVEKHET